MEIYSLYARPLAVTQIKEHIPKVEVIQNCTSWSNYDNLGEYSNDKKILSKFPELQKVITEKVQEYNDHVMTYTDNEVQLISSWTTKYQPGYQGNLHNHDNTMYSVVFYPVSGGSNITFIDYNNKWQWYVRPKKINHFNQQRLTITPEAGMLVIFPGFAHHKVDVNADNQSRYSIVANYTITGPVGYDDTSWHNTGHATE